jgi:hypothetical protein
MSTTRFIRPGRILLALVTVLLLAGCGGASEHPKDPRTPPVAAASKVEIPESIRIEHEQIHGALVAATEAPGRAGEAARELASVLHPHFVREEEIALPPLALLAPLARGEFTPEMLSVLPLTDALRAEMPEMLRQHGEIAAAARRLEQTAQEEGNHEIELVAKKLQLHARSEEEVFYPAAILVGELVRVRAAARK